MIFLDAPGVKYKKDCSCCYRSVISAAANHLECTAGLSSLQQLWLEANPIACARLYRIDVLACFPESQGVLLDGKPDRRSEREMAALRALVRPQTRP